MVVELCEAQLQASGGASDGSTWICDQQEDRIGPHRVSWETRCSIDGEFLVCSVSWDRHDGEHEVRNT